MPARGDVVAQLFEGAGGSVGLWDLPVERPPERLAELLQRAAEELTGGLEFGAEAQEPERVVPRHVEAAAELLEQKVEALPALGGEAGEPRLEQRASARVHVPSYRWQNLPLAELCHGRGDGIPRH